MCFPGKKIAMCFFILYIVLKAANASESKEYNQNDSTPNRESNQRARLIATDKLPIVNDD